MLDPTTAERLIRLRALLARAIATASDVTAAGRHLAVVSLDGVCEQALHLAADELNVEVRTKDGLLDVHGKVAGTLGTGWTRSGGKGVRELHLSRNNVQHHGVLPDAEHVRIWVSEVELYVHSLIESAFAVVLDEVRASTAVADGDLRSRLEGVEQAIETADFSDAVGKSYLAVEFARRRFKSLRGARDIRLGGIDKLREFRDIQNAIQQLDEFIDIAYLAPDPSEWLWLKEVQRLRRGRSDGPSQSDAQRAYAFALTWILRLEAFVARQPSREIPEPPTVSLDREYASPQISGISGAEDAGWSSDHLGLRVALSDVPPEWLRQTHQGLQSIRDAGRAQGLELVQEGDGDDLIFTVLDSVGPERVHQLINEVIESIHSAFLGMIERRREERQVEEDAADAYLGALGEDPKGLIGDLAAEHRAGPRGGLMMRAHLRLPEDVDHHLVQEALQQFGAAGVDNDHVMHFDPEVFPAPSLPTRVGQAVESARSLALSASAAAAKREQRRQELLDALMSSPRGSPPAQQSTS